MAEINHSSHCLDERKERKEERNEMKTRLIRVMLGRGSMGCGVRYQGSVDLSSITFNTALPPARDNSHREPPHDKSR